MAAALAVPGVSLAAQPASFDLRSLGWMPGLGRQSGPVCSVWATSRAVSWLMGRTYGWKHGISMSYVDVLARAEARPEMRRMMRVMADVNQTGYRYYEHPSARIKAGYRELYDIEAIKRALWQYKQPVVVSTYNPDQGYQGVWTADTVTPYAHAIFVTGYTAEGLDFQNSWGAGWGPFRNGYGRMTNGFIDRNFQQAYALTSVKA